MAAKSTRADRLEKYRAKRSADRSPEPVGGEGSGAGQPGVFVVQKHAARRLHYDLRLEINGVLQSWAVPRGPSLDPAEKRLAVQTEDHPLEYVDFEGVIPAGNYGAGAMIVWDRGTWVPLEDPDRGMVAGKLLFELRGYKLRGVWTLVRTKRPRGEGGKEPSREWLLIKKVDGASRTADTEAAEAFAPESILSGLTIEELRDGPTRAAELADALARLGAPKRPVEAERLEVMLAETGERPFSDPAWLFELKHDGFRLLAARDGDEARLRYRRGRDATAVFPEIERVVRALALEAFVIDGEVVVLEDDGRASFQKLQRRALQTRLHEVRRAMIDLPATYYVFDLLAFAGFDLRGLPLLQRKELLRKLLPGAGPVRFTDHIVERGEELFAEVERLGLEGLVAKKADAPYRSARSPTWLKLRVDRTGDFAIVGFTSPKGARAGFGALHLATWQGGGLVYAGRVGTGFGDAQLDDLRAALEPRRRRDPPCTGPVPRGAEHVWVEPALVGEVRFKEVTGDGLLRQPAFLRLREDKAVADCAPAAAARGDQEADPPAPSDASGAAAGDDASAGDATHDETGLLAGGSAVGAGVGRIVRFSNRDKVFWPADGYTKGDLIDFYRAVSPWILPLLRDRPVVLTRYPDGIDGKSFFQKDAPGFVPGWVRTERMWSEHARREIDYFVCDHEETLLFLANLATIPLHIWSSRVATLAHPDWCILDLDPKGAPFADVVAVARAIRALADEMAVPSFVKTSGSTGLHVLLPLGGQCTYEQSRTLAELCAKVIAHEHPDIATTARAIGARGGRVYIDYLQNGHGRLLAAPLSVRPRPGATVSTPLAWREVNAKLDPGRFTIRTVPTRLARQQRDPFAGILDARPDLPHALERLAARLA
jgi:bifunctional non-homologous end joining protein LigD